MGRKSKTTPQQDQKLIERHLAGESIRSLAKEVGISEASLRAKISAQATEIKDVANQLVATEKSLKALPWHSQNLARSRAALMAAIEDNVFAGIVNGSASFVKLTSMANTELLKVDESDLLSDDSKARLSMVAGLNKMANETVAPAMSIVNGNKERLTRVLAEAEVIENDPQNIGSMSVLDAAKAYQDFVSG